METLKRTLNAIVYAIAFLAVGYAVYNVAVECSTGNIVPPISYTDTTGTYNKLFYESEISELKKENKELYDSLKDSRDKIAFLVQFTASRHYSTGKVVLNGDTIVPQESKTFEYEDSNDTLSYNLKINAEKEPNWYSLDVSTKDKYTIVDKEYENGLNHVTIDGGVTDISDVTAYKKEEGKSILKRLAVGPTISFGYDMANKRLSPIVGIGITYNLFGD